MALEAQAILSILAKCEAGAFTLVLSEVVQWENDLNPIPQKKTFVSSILATCGLFAMVTNPSEVRAQALASRGFKALDALHISVAESAEVDYFCSCDDRLLSKAQAQADLTIQVRSPLELVQEIFT